MSLFTVQYRESIKRLTLRGGSGPPRGRQKTVAVLIEMKPESGRVEDG